MSKRFLPWAIDQVSQFSPSVSDYVPASHPAHFVRDLVRDELDLEAVYTSYDDARGAPAFHPTMPEQIVRLPTGRFTKPVLKLCAEAGLVKLGHVALDGTKIKANASKHKASLASPEELNFCIY